LNGILLISKEDDAFLKLYQEFKELVFKQVALAMPSEEELQARINLRLCRVLDQLEQIEEAN